MGIVDSFYELVDRGREGKNIGLSMGLPKMEEYIDGLTQGTSYLIGAGSGTGCFYKNLNFILTKLLLHKILLYLYIIKNINI